MTISEPQQLETVSGISEACGNKKEFGQVDGGMESTERSFG